MESPSDSDSDQLFSQAEIAQMDMELDPGFFLGGNEPEELNADELLALASLDAPAAPAPAPAPPRAFRLAPLLNRKDYATHLEFSSGAAPTWHDLAGAEEQVVRAWIQCALDRCAAGTHAHRDLLQGLPNGLRFMHERVCKDERCHLFLDYDTAPPADFDEKAWLKWVVSQVAVRSSNPCPSYPQNLPSFLFFFFRRHCISTDSNWWP